MSTLNKIALFRWRASAYFFSALFMTLGASFATGNATTTTKEWVIAGAAALGAAWTALKGFLDTATQTKKE